MVYRKFEVHLTDELPPEPTFEPNIRRDSEIEDWI